MRIPTTRVKKIDDAQRRLMAGGGAIPAAGRITREGTIDHVAGRPAHDRRPKDDNDQENFNADGSRKERDEREPDFEINLLCRTFVGDSGIRPLSGIMFWESPDIWIEGPSGDPDIATPGVINKVKVHIWNLGLADCWAAHVDAYWCNPSVGLNAASAQPIGAAVETLASGQHKVVSFDWTPDLVNGGHQCLFAQVYHPVSDPIVAPFNPVQDRHVAQRNISVVQVAPGETMKFDFFTQNLSLNRARTRLEIQKLEGPALRTVAMALGRRVWRAAAAENEVDISRPVRVELPRHSEQLSTGLFRETMQPTPPGVSQTRRVAGALRFLTAPARVEGPRNMRSESSGPDTIATASPKTERYPDTDAELVMTKVSGDHAGLRLEIPPERRVRLALEASLPKTARRGAADVYRVVERTAGQITGGITIVLQAK